MSLTLSELTSGRIPRASTGGVIVDDANSPTCDASGNIAIAGNLAANGSVDLSAAAAGQVKFPAAQNASANPNTLDDYDEYVSASTACSGALTDAVSWRIVKIGKIVTLTMPAIYNTTTNVANINYGLAIPAKYRPAYDQAQFINTIIGGAGSGTPGMATVAAATGIITLYRDGTAGTGWGTAANTGMLYATSLSWSQ